MGLVMLFILALFCDLVSEAQLELFDAYFISWRCCGYVQSSKGMHGPSGTSSTSA